MNEQEEFEFRARAEREAGQKQQGPDWKGVVSNAAKEALMRPGTNIRDLAINPVTQAKALPPLAGAVGALSPIPGGATMGTVGGRQLSNLALKAYGHPEEIPSGLSQVGEAGLSAVGDLAAIPAMKSAYFGKQIGSAERAAGLANIEKEAPPSGARTAVKFIQGLQNKMNGAPMSTEEALKVKPAIDWIFKKGWLNGTPYEADLAKLSQRVSTVANQIPGRGAASQGMAQANVLPNMMRRGFQAVPTPVKIGFGIGGGAGGAEVIAHLLKSVLGG